MPNRTVSVALKLLIGDYTGAADKAAASTDKIGESAQKSGDKYKAGSRAIVGAATVAGAAGALALGKIVSASMDFGKAMSNVQAVSGATGDQMKALSDAAIKAGADTAFSASQAADAEAELAKAGVSTTDILGGGLSGALSLAAAGQLDLGNAATIAANAMNIFGLHGKDVGHIADVLAAGANKSAADVDQLAQAMSQGGQVASSLGLGLEDTVGVLAMFADAGLKGSDAGTSLKTMLQALAAPSSQAAAMMKQLGLNAFDASGNFVGMAAFAGQLQQRLGGLTQQQRANALATIFGADAVRVANVLFKEGSAGVKEYTAAVNDQGAAARNAATQQDNLAGDIEQLSGSIDTALIKSGSGANSVLREMTQLATGAVNAFGDLPGPVQASATGLLAIGTGSAAAIAGLGIVVPRIQAGRKALADMGSAGEKANTALGKIGRGIGVGSGIAVGVTALIGGLAKLQDALQDSAPDVDRLTQSLIKARDWSDIGKILGYQIDEVGGAIKELTDDSLDAKINRFVGKLTSIDTPGFEKAQRNIGAVDQALAQLVQGGHSAEAKREFDLIAQAASAQGVSVDKVREALPKYAGALASVQNEATLAGKATKDAGDAASGAAAPTQELSDAQKAAAAEAGKLTDAMLGESSASSVLAAALDLISGNSTAVVSSQIAFRNSLADLTEAHKQNGSAVGQSTQKARDNASAILAAMSAAEQNAEAVAKQAEAEGKGAQAVTLGTAAYDRSVGAIRKAALAAGFNKTQVDALIASVYKTPAQRGTTVTAPGAKQSKADIDAHNAAAGKVPTYRSTQVSAPGADSAAAKMGAVARAANDIPTHVTTTVDTIYRSFDIGGGRRRQGPGMNAAGTPSWEGGLTWVGERGPELVNLPAGTAIYPADKSAAMARTLTPAGGGSERMAAEIRALRGDLSKLASRTSPLVNIERNEMADGIAVDLLAHRVRFLEGAAAGGFS